MTSETMCLPFHYIIYILYAYFYIYIHNCRRIRPEGHTVSAGGNHQVDNFNGVFRKSRTTFIGTQVVRQILLNTHVYLKEIRQTKNTRLNCSQYIRCARRIQLSHTIHYLIIYNIIYILFILIWSLVVAQYFVHHTQQEFSTEH